jgi:hypothetical protein
MLQRNISSLRDFGICFVLVNYKYIVPAGTPEGNANAFVALIAITVNMVPGGALSEVECGTMPHSEL